MVIKPNPDLPENPAAAESEVEEVNLSGVVVQRLNWNGFELTIDHGSYTGKTSALLTKALVEMSPKTDAGTTMADRLAISKLKKSPGDLAGVPTLKKADNTLDMRWARGGGEAHIDFAPYFMVNRFPIPKGTRAHIPVTIENVQGLGMAMKIFFSQTKFEAVQEKKKGSTSGEAAAAKQDGGAGGGGQEKK